MPDKTQPMKLLLTLATAITLSSLVHADPPHQTLDEIQAQKKAQADDIRKDREREALHRLLEAVTKSQEQK